MPLLSEPRNAWRLIFARKLLIWTINDMMSLETNYVYIFKYVISSKSTETLQLYSENMQKDIIAVFPRKRLFHYFVLYICSEGELCLNGSDRQETGKLWYKLVAS